GRIRRIHCCRGDEHVWSDFWSGTRLPGHDCIPRGPAELGAVVGGPEGSWLRESVGPGCAGAGAGLMILRMPGPYDLRFTIYDLRSTVYDLRSTMDDLPDQATVPVGAPGMPGPGPRCDVCRARHARPRRSTIYDLRSTICDL